MDHGHHRGGQLIKGGQSLREALQVASRELQAADLAFGHGTGNAADEAAFLLLEGLGLPIDDPETAAGRILTDEEADRLAVLIERRERDRVPAPYVVGAAYVGPFRFRADERALVPRSFIGELLVAGMDSDEPLPLVPRAATHRILDLCTGSASLAILAAHAFPDASVDAVDLSTDALDLAALNVADHDLGDRVRLLAGDLFDPVAGNRYDLIVTNPPYVTSAAMAELPPEYRREPGIGLDGGADGLDLVRRILDRADAFLVPEGAMICEIGAGQPQFEQSFPTLDVLWLDTEESSGEVFRVDAAALSAHKASGHTTSPAE